MYQLSRMQDSDGRVYENSSVCSSTVQSNWKASGKMNSLAKFWPNYGLRYFTDETLLFRPNNSDEARRFSRNNEW